MSKRSSDQPSEQEEKPGDQSSKKPRPRHRRLEVALATAVTLTLGPILVGLLHAGWASEGRLYDVSDDVPARDVIMVLGAQAHPSRPSRFLAARLEVAVRLFNEGKGKVILVTGANTAASNYETQVMEDYLVSRGIPASQIVQDVAGFDTYDSCIRARDVFGVRELTLVSQPYHLPRAVATCRALGVDAIGVGEPATQQNWPPIYLRNELREFLAVVKMDLDLLRGAKATDSPPTTAIQDALKHS